MISSLETCYIDISFFFSVNVVHFLQSQHVYVAT